LSSAKITYAHFCPAPGCGKSFQGRKNRVFCSDACRIRNWAKKRTEVPSDFISRLRRYMAAINNLLRDLENGN
jgi:endogenous inhibitor of DNA gyrase (YacG/DUF329 family)